MGASQSWSGIGWIDSDPEKMALKGEWFMMVNFRTRTKNGQSVIVRCMFKNDIASTFEEQFRKLDVLFLTGEVDEYHAGAGYDNFQFKNVINILSFSFITDNVGQLEPLSIEKAEWLQSCSDLFDHNAPKPTEEDVLHYKELNAKRAKQNIERREKAGIPIGKKQY
jgi:hypothetical protein